MAPETAAQHEVQRRAKGATLKAGGSRRRREQQRRATARHVQWLLSLLQAGDSHNTAASRQSDTALRQPADPLKADEEEVLAAAKDNVVHSSCAKEKEQIEAVSATGKEENEENEENEHAGMTNNAWDDLQAAEQHAYGEELMGSVVVVTEEVERILKACKEIGFLGANSDEELEQHVAAAGKRGRVFFQGPENTAKIRIPHVGRLWYPVSVLTPCDAELSSEGTDEEEKKSEEGEYEESESESEEEPDERTDGNEIRVARMTQEQEEATAWAAAASRLKMYCSKVRQSMQDAKLSEKLEADDKRKIETAVQETLAWVETHWLAGADEAERKHEELEGLVKPVMLKANLVASGRLETCGEIV